MAERSKAAVLKTVNRKVRGFESCSLRHIFNKKFDTRCGEMAERLKAIAC